MRLEGKTALIMGAGQSPGQGVGNGRQPALIGKGLLAAMLSQLGLSHGDI